jgi:hypothetical protein
VKNLDLVDGTFTLYDSTASQPADSVIEHRIDYSHITLEHVGIKLSAVASATMLDAKIQEIRCTFPRNGILVKKISGEFLVDTTRAEVKNLNIFTQNTSIECNASLQKVNILRLTTLEALENTPVKVQCRAPRVDFAELKIFLPSLSFLEGSGSAAISLSGRFADISIDAIDVSASSCVVKHRYTIR